MINYNEYLINFKKCIDNIDISKIIDIFNIEDLILKEKTNIDKRKDISFYNDFILDYNNNLKNRLKKSFSKISINNFNYESAYKQDIVIILPDSKIIFNYSFSKSIISNYSLSISFKIEKEDLNFEYQIDFFNHKNKKDEDKFSIIIEDKNKLSFFFSNNQFFLLNNLSIYNKYKDIIIFNILSKKDENVYNFFSSILDGIFSVPEKNNTYSLTYKNKDKESFNNIEFHFESFDDIPKKINDIIKLSKINNSI